MYSPTVLSTFFPLSIYGTIILSSIIKLSAESTSPSSIKQINSTNSPGPVSEEERLQYLAELQAATTTTEIPALVFLLILAITGLIGNSLVIFVYSLKFKQSATRVLIISIAGFDLVANVLAIPGDIYDMFHIWDFNNPTLCRSRLFFSAFTTLSSAIALLAIAVVRYRKICTPHNWQITIGKAKVISAVIGFLGVIFSIPYAIINGRRTKETTFHNVTGFECTTDDTYFGTIWPLLNYGFFLVLYICCGTALTVLYILVGVQAWKHRKRHITSPRPVSTPKTKTISSPFCEINQSQQSQATNSTSDCVGNVGQLGSSDSLDIISNTNECSNNKHLSEIVEQVDQYTVRIFHDRVEIRTPMMGEMIVNLQMTTSGMESVAGNPDIVDEAQHPVYVDPIMLARSHLGCSDVNIDDGKIDTSTVGSENYDHARGGCREEIKSKSVPNLLTEQRTDPISSHVEQRTYQSTFTANPELTSDMDQVSDFGPTTPISCTNPWEEATSDIHPLTSEKHSLTSDIHPLTSDKHSLTSDIHPPTSDKHSLTSEIHPLTSDKHSLTSEKHSLTSDMHPLTSDMHSLTSNKHSLTSDLSQTLCDFDPVAALKWVDIVYSPEEDLTTANIDTPKTGNSFTFRISPTNNLLLKADWLRNIIAEALAKSRSRHVRSGEDTDLNKDEKVEITILEDEDTVNTNENRREHNSCTENTKQSSTFPLKSRMKNLITKKFSTLKGPEQRESKGQQVSRTTVMLIIISAIYILGFIPHLAIMFYKYLDPDEVATLGTAGVTALNLFGRSFFLNCAANPIIYSLCNKNFRRECIAVFSCFSRG